MDEPGGPVEAVAPGVPVDVLVVVIDSTGGWRSAADELTAGLRRAGASAALVRTGPVPRVRTFALTDYTQARLARRAARAGIAAHAPRAIVYCSIVGALLWPRPGAIFLDSMAAENRPGRHGVWQRRVERRRLREAPLLLPWSARTLDPLAGTGHAPAAVLAPPIGSPVAAAELEAALRDVDVVVYAGDPEKRRLALLLSEWARVRRPDEVMVVAGLDGLRAPPGVRSAGRLDRDAFRALLRRARVFAAAPRREDHGIAALEALAAGCRLVTTPAPGPYPALELARTLDGRLVGGDLGGALRVALDDPLAGYVARALELVAPFTDAGFDAALTETVVPRLLAGWGAPARAPA